MTAITFMGQKLNIGFCLAVEIEYEQLTGKSFALDALESTAGSLWLYLAAIHVYNEDCKLTYQDIARKADGNDVAAMRDAMVKEFTTWASGTRNEDENTGNP